MERHPYQPDGETTICRDNFHTATSQRMGGHVFGPDRFIVCKFPSPRRWDLLVFRFPEDPTIVYVKRLVGLPGETVYIKDGKVWVNGNELTPPAQLRELKYSASPAYPEGAMSGTQTNPARLGRDEFFVLGDFSASSKDSRYWDRGAPGHPPYAVPKSHIVGVVTHIFWPPSRMRILR
jgi:signal peptidase I